MFSSGLVDVCLLWNDLQMAVEVDDADWAILASVCVSDRSEHIIFSGNVPVDRAQQRQSDCMVATKGDQTRQCLALLGWAGLLSICVRRAAQEKVVAFFDLLQRVGVVISVGRCKDSTRSRVTLH